ncbi:hypothetical protein IE81DRAFT_320864 [Ceraceosorus guamensis]|uniref:Peroxin/Ferlin domain-containing protein n=1 Tax=Ceraceosorus guamensis TaxID=1522189 RepID=A0A316W4T0_9BASI|nr:hypothetical protein IE81DRAFT_320864 [Ceraceosorus guamensis]PWN44890.1 hypothetical protein IE81DRAFT_320864 [Ceraceosorus guamensis]
MAALDLPLNDAYLSALHETRNLRKAEARRLAALRAAGDIGEAGTDQIDMSNSNPSSPKLGDDRSEAEAEGKGEALANKTGPEAGLIGGSAAAARGGAAGLAIAAASPGDLSISDTSVLAGVPTPLLRLLVLLSPAITTLALLVRLATWTGGPGTGSHSVLLVLAWWGVCLYGYEVLRYAPQLVLLSVIGFAGLRAAVRGEIGAQKKRTPPVTSSSLNVVLADLSELADFLSTVSGQVVTPFLSLLSWRSGNSANTRRLATFLIITWPAWLICFSPGLWDAFNLPRVGLQLGQRVTHASSTVASRVWPHAVRSAIAIEAQVSSRVSGQALVYFIKFREAFLAAVVYYRLHVRPTILHVGENLHLPLLAPKQGTHSVSALALLPPWPLFALSLRHALLTIGTIALTWCAPWAALIRHALWRSATIRRSVLGLLRILSGEPRRAFVSGRVAYTGRSSSEHAVGGDDSKDELSVPSFFAAPRIGSAKSAKVNLDVTRHEDVEYQFTIFENQRWWVGLDWTAALLPQERPAWSDESNSPVSPPSSFSLPPARVTLKASPTSSNPAAYVRRLVKWQWIDPEWTVAGRDPLPGSGDFGGSGSEEGALSGLRAGRRTSNASSGDRASDLPFDLALLDVDADGWQYGDNAWEKMSRKNQMGRYTRRRRWVRRAVLVELVERNYTPTAAEKAQVGASGGVIDVSPGYLPVSAGGTGTSLASSSSSGALARIDESKEIDQSSEALISPTSPRGDLKQRLARAAA